MILKRWHFDNKWIQGNPWLGSMLVDLSFPKIPIKIFFFFLWIVFSDSGWLVGAFIHNCRGRAKFCLGSSQEMRSPNMLEILPQRAISLDETKHFENPKFKWKFPMQLKYFILKFIIYDSQIPCSTCVTHAMSVDELSSCLDISQKNLWNSI